VISDAIALNNPWLATTSARGRLECEQDAQRLT